MNKVFIICPVRNQTKEQQLFIADYVEQLEELGSKVHWPFRDTFQDDPIGDKICLQNQEAILNADEVHIYFDPSSTGTLFDLGMAFMAAKKMVLINYWDVPATEDKSFNNLLLKLAVRY